MYSSSVCLRFALVLGVSSLLFAACCKPSTPDATPDAPSVIHDGKLDPDALSPRGNESIASFRTSKKMIPEIFKGMEKTFYCGCTYSKKKKINHKSCGYKVRKNKGRAGRLEIEHVVPASAFGHNFAPWKTGAEGCLNSKGKPYKGRRCAEKASRAFRHMEADLYNLQPAVGEVNGDRSDKGVGEIAGEERKYGRCDVEIDPHTVEPREGIRGDVARVYMYMDWAYPGHGIIHDGNRDLLERWHKSDPVDGNERKRGRRIAKKQGNSNPFLK